MSEAARAFAEREIGPIAAELDESERFPAELYAKLAKLG
ncbi:MAG: acyl-CoA dehydrogenase family protein, partial [Hyphomicrobiales bacterium]|nr:acyl-CoA dehydrogenase family protein [Hyphomicrobiales bacterium]